VTNALAHLAELEARQGELQREQRGIEDRRVQHDRELADLSERARTTFDVDELRKLEEQIAEVGLWHRVEENRAPSIERELKEIAQQLAEAQRGANRARVADLLVEVDAVFGEILAGIDRVAELRQRAVASGAPQTLLAPPPDVHDPVDVKRLSASDVEAFVIVDRLAAHLRGQWAQEIVPLAQQDLGQ